MKKNKKKMLLTVVGNYYSNVKEKSDRIADLYFKGDEIKKSELYNLVLNLVNQVVYDYTYTFTQRDLYFIAENNINVNSLLEEFIGDIEVLKNKIDNV